MKKEDIEHAKKALEYLNNVQNHIGNPHFNLKQDEKFKVNIKIDDSIAPAMFLPDKENPGQWFANNITFRAMKKDIFALDDDLIELSDNYTCKSCKNELDRQFWHFCPYCEASFRI